MSASDPPGPLLGSGRAADVYDIGAGRVLRRYRTPFDVQPEAAIMRHLHGAGFAVPAIYDAEGSDLVMERLDGRDMLVDLAAGPGWRDGTRGPSRRCITACTRFRLRRGGRRRSDRVTRCCTSTCTRATSC